MKEPQPLHFSQTFKKQQAKLDRPLRMQIRDKLQQVARGTLNPRSLRYDKKGLWKIRVGKYRVILSAADDGGWNVLFIGHRQTIYK